MKSSIKSAFPYPKINENGEEERSCGEEGVRKVAPPPPKKLERKPTEDINASAEAFIRKFKQQLHLQRLESLENFEQMLKRGA
ncbi:hypothetical protein SASPL_115771 [Salvia splendens]|uniref:Uncharacterized protein n=1 Tax=Salvia splendens TaxID=180675 RepID=A0A8X8Y8Z1_SALSN|nr:hypothetical protein SASPL_115771 [Salvia splendens]